VQVTTLDRRFHRSQSSSLNFAELIEPMQRGWLDVVGD
jgi:hypothetical protein